MASPHVELDIFGDASSRIVLRTVDGSSTSNHANLSFCVGSGAAPSSGNTLGVIESNVTATGGTGTNATFDILAVGASGEITTVDVNSGSGGGGGAQPYGSTSNAARGGRGGSGVVIITYDT